MLDCYHISSYCRTLSVFLLPCSITGRNTPVWTVRRFVGDVTTYTNCSPRCGTHEVTIVIGRGTRASRSAKTRIALIQHENALVSHDPGDTVQGKLSRALRVTCRPVMNQICRAITPVR